MGVVFEIELIVFFSGYRDFMLCTKWKKLWKSLRITDHEIGAKTILNHLKQWIKIIGKNTSTKLYHCSHKILTRFAFKFTSEVKRDTALLCVVARMYRHILFSIIDNSMTLSTQQDCMYINFFFLFLKVICSLSVLILSCYQHRIRHSLSLSFWSTRPLDVLRSVQRSVEPSARWVLKCAAGTRSVARASLLGIGGKDTNILILARARVGNHRKKRRIAAVHRLQEKRSRCSYVRTVFVT